MTGSIFEDWLKGVDRRMRLQNRHILMLVDNATSHIFNKAEITNVHVEFFAPNLTSHLQPADGGIIRCFKAHYRRLFCMRAVDREALGHSDIYEINQLEAMELAAQAWLFVSQATISNVWKHVKIFQDDAAKSSNSALEPEISAANDDTPLSDPDLDRATTQLNERIDELVEMNALRPNQRMDAEYLLDVEDERVTVKEWTDEDIWEEVNGQSREEQNGDIPEESEDLEPPKPTITMIKEAITAM